MSLRLLLAFAPILAAPMQDPAAAELPDCPTEVFRSLLPSGFGPRPAWEGRHPLPGRFVGVLIAPDALTGDVKERLRFHDGFSGNHAVVSVDGDPFYRFRMAGCEKGEGVQSLVRVPVGADGSELLEFADVSSRTTLERLGARWELSAPLALVELEVNGGRGMVESLRKDLWPSYVDWIWTFVATDMRCVEGSAEYPLRVADCFERSRVAYEATLEAHADEIARAMKEVVDASARATRDLHAKLRGRRVSGAGRDGLFPALVTRDATKVATYASVAWLRESRRLQVSWATRFNEGEAHMGSVHSGGEVPPRMIQWGIAYGVEVGESHAFDVEGELVERRFVGPARFRKTVLP